MKKILILFFFLSAFSLTGKAQVGAQVVNDPLNMAINTSTNALTQITNGINVMMSTLNLDQLDFSFFNDVCTVMDIVTYIDKIACLTTQLNVGLKYANNYRCLTMLNVEGITMNINYSSQIMNKLFLSGNIVTMSKEARVRTLNDVLKTLKDVSDNLASTNLVLNNYAKNEITSKYLNKTFFSLPSSAVGNRYNRQ
jgi:hypothetical protein